MFAVTNGMLFMIKAGILSGDYYVQAALTFLAIFPMVMFPRFAPLIFGIVAAACFFVTGLKYRFAGCGRHETREARSCAAWHPS